MIDVDHESQDPYGSGGDTPSYNPVSKDYVPPNPAGSPVYHVNFPNRYCPNSGEPILGPSTGQGLGRRRSGHMTAICADLAKVLCNIAYLFPYDAPVSPRYCGRQAGVPAVGRLILL